MSKLECWDGQAEHTEIEYDIEETKETILAAESNVISKAEIYVKYDELDKTDYIVAVSCGILIGLFDSFWVGEFSLSAAQEWGRTRANSFVIKVAKARGYSKNELDGAIRFLEKDAPMASDKMTNIWGRQTNGC